jgi:hypothetical protein
MPQGTPRKKSEFATAADLLKKEVELATSRLISALESSPRMMETFVIREHFRRDDQQYWDGSRRVLYINTGDIHNTPSFRTWYIERFFVTRVAFYQEVDRALFDQSPSGENLKDINEFHLAVSIPGYHNATDEGFRSVNWETLAVDGWNLATLEKTAETLSRCFTEEDILRRAKEAEVRRLSYS